MSKPQSSPQSSAKRVAAHRQRMRDAGFVPRTIWVHDTRSPEYLAEAGRQARLIAANVEGESEIMDWLDQVRDWPTT